MEKLANNNDVILWGIGCNKNNNSSVNVNPINFSNFKLIGLRDYCSSYPSKEIKYCPCVSCLSELFDRSFNILRDVGVVCHYEFDEQFTGYDYIKNDDTLPFNEYIQFIASSNIIVTNSYHAVYWGTLLNKRIILFGAFSNKFDYFKYPPVKYSGDLVSDIKLSRSYPEALDESRKYNLDFLSEVLKFCNKS